MSQLCLVVRRSAGKWKDSGLTLHFSSPFSFVPPVNNFSVSVIGLLAMRKVPLLPTHLAKANSLMFSVIILLADILSDLEQQTSSSPVVCPDLCSSSVFDSFGPVSEQELRTVILGLQIIVVLFEDITRCLAFFRSVPV